MTLQIVIIIPVSYTHLDVYKRQVVRIIKDLDTDITNKHVLVVEDIIDSGLTLSWIMANLSSRKPASLEICTLLRKPEVAKVKIDVKYVGFDITNEFVVGYGLDFDELYRNLPYIAILKPELFAHLMNHP